MRFPRINTPRCITQSRYGFLRTYYRASSSDYDWTLQSLLAQLLMQFPLIRARHPATVVLVNCGATNLISAKHRLGLGVVDTFAMGMGPTAMEKDCA